MFHRLRQTKYLAPLLLAANLLFAVYILHLGHPYYELNDEYGIGIMLAGVSGTATANGIFINVLLGGVLKLASALLPGVDWLWLTMVATTVVSFTVLGWALLRVAGWRGLFPYLLILFAYGCKFYLVWNFTRPAALAAATGFTVLLLLPHVPDRKFSDYLPGILLVWVGWLLRNHAAGMVIALVGPALALLALPPPVRAARTKDTAFFARHKPELAAAAALGAVLLLSLLAQGVADHATKECGDYIAYNDARTEVLDYPIADYDEHAADYAALGITKEDLELIKAWTFADYERITTETFHKIAMIEVNQISWKERAKEALGYQRALLPERMVVKLAVVLLVAILLLIRRLNLPATAAVTACMALIHFGLILTRRCPLRVLDSLDIAFLILLAAVQPWPRPGEKTAKPGLVCLRAFGSVAMAVVFVLLLEGRELRDPDLWRDRALPPAQMAADRAELAQKLDPDILYLRDNGSRASYWGLYPLGAMPPAGAEQNLVSLGGWEVQAPYYNKQLSNYGVKNPMRALAEQDNVLLLDFSTDRVRMKQGYLRRYYNATLHWSMVDTLLDQPVVAFTAVPQGNLPAASGAQLTVRADPTVGETDLRTLTGTLQGLPEEASIYSLLLRGTDGTEHCFRFLPDDAGTAFTVAVPAELLPDGRYTVTALCKTDGSAAYNRQSLPTTLEVVTERA